MQLLAHGKHSIDRKIDTQIAKRKVGMSGDIVVVPAFNVDRFDTELGLRAEHLRVNTKRHRVIPFATFMTNLNFEMVGR